MAYPTLTVPKGQTLRVSALFKSLGEFIDPTTVTCKYALTASPGSPTSASVVKAATGKYHADIDTTSLTAGEYTVTWKGVGAALALRERKFVVTTPVIP